MAKIDVCDCGKKILSQLSEAHVGSNFVQGQFDYIYGMPYMIFNVEFEGKKRGKKVEVFFTYCPFCAKKLIINGDEE